MGRIAIPEVPHSPNGPMGLLRMHWTARRKYNDRWFWLVRAGLPPQTPPEGRVKVSIVQTRRRKLDPDNLVASCKPVIDALVRLGVAKDDSEEFMELSVSQRVGKPAGMEVTWC